MSSSLCQHYGCKSKHDGRTKNQRIHIIVCGLHFETLESTLNRFPETLLGNPCKRQKYFDQDKKSLMFNRNRESFHAILFYYQSPGILSCPSDVSLSNFIEEARFFEIDPSHLTCEDDEKLPKRRATHPPANWKEICWFTLEYPNFSKLARVVSILCIISIVYGILVYCLETEKWLQKALQAHNQLSLQRKSAHPSGTVSDIWHYLELLAVGLFSLDFFLRLLFAPRKLDYVCSTYGIIDLLSLLPSYAWLSIDIVELHSPEWLRRGICFLRCLRVLKLTRYSYGVQYVTWVLSKTIRDIPCFNLDMFVCLIFFATLLFNAEHRENAGNGFDSIPEAIWYVVISMTTVGYGDVVSVTLEGKLTSMACVLIGLLVLVSLPTPFFFQKFGNIYTSEKEQSNIENEDGVSEW